MTTQTQLLLLQKTMVVVEGVARKLYPETNIWEVSKPVLENWIRDFKSPQSNIDKAINTSTKNFRKDTRFSRFYGQSQLRFTTNSRRKA